MSKCESDVCCQSEKCNEEQQRRKDTKPRQKRERHRLYWSCLRIGHTSVFTAQCRASPAAAEEAGGAQKGRPNHAERTVAIASSCRHKA